MIRTANIRLLKDRLSAFLRDVQRGDVQEPPGVVDERRLGGESPAARAVATS